MKGNKNYFAILGLLSIVWIFQACSENVDAQKQHSTSNVSVDVSDKSSPKDVIIEEEEMEMVTRNGKPEKKQGL